MKNQTNPAIDFSRMRALVVEDNEFIRLTLKKNLQDFGFMEVLEAVSGEEAVASFKKSPHLILCDINMTPGDGFSFLRHVRDTAPPAGKVPFIFLTGNADEDSVAKAIGMSADGYLLKPVTPETLKTKIVKVLEKLKAGGR